MEKVELKRSGFWWGLYTMTFNGERLPQDTCTYIRFMILSSIVSLTLLPFTIGRVLFRGFIMLVNKFGGYTEYIKGAIGFVSTAMGMVLPAIIGGKTVDEPYTFDWTTYPLDWITGIGIITVMGLAMGLIVFIIIGITEYGGKTKDIVMNSNNGTISAFKTWKEKHCKKINWK